MCTMQCLLFVKVRVKQSFKFVSFEKTIDQSLKNLLNFYKCF